MKIREILVEYKREVTLRQVGDRLIPALLNDNSVTFFPNLRVIRRNADTIQKDHQLLHDAITVIMEVIEGADPTPNKIYTPWLARMYVKGKMKIEDMNRLQYLNRYDSLRRRNKLKPEHKDINKFSSYTEFENAVEQYDDEPERTVNKGNSEVYYEDDDVRVIIPKDKDAACYYGRGTRWCTAATKGTNYFDEYNKSGPLYIVLPKRLRRAGEKYQLHFETAQFMDENDADVSISFLLSNFPTLKKLFMLAYPDALIFASDATIIKLMKQLKNIVTPWIANVMQHIEKRDLLWKEYKEANPNSKKTYREYRPILHQTADTIQKRMDEVLNSSPNEVRRWAEVYDSNPENSSIVDFIPIAAYGLTSGMYGYGASTDDIYSETIKDTIGDMIIQRLTIRSHPVTNEPYITAV